MSEVVKPDPPMRYPYQEPTAKCADFNAVVALYGKPAFKRELYGDDTNGKFRFPNTTRLLGNPLVGDFAKRNIVAVTVPGFGPDKSRTQTLDVHRKIKPLVLAAFQKVKELKLPYVLHEAGGHVFRYQLNPTVRAALVNRPEYADLKNLPNWNINCAERDLKNNAFDELVQHNGRLVEKKHLLSNHSFGSALDINSESNPYDHDRRFDMPKRIVKVFEGLGFYWGGYYGDYMHFEYERSSIASLDDELPPEVLYPLTADLQRESPLKYFFLNEGGPGGFFPLGRQQNLHAGVHLEPESREELVPVKAAMPGYIVAARLMTPGKEGNSPFLLDATEGRPLGFVLVRHELTKPASPPPTGAASTGSTAVSTPSTQAAAPSPDKVHPLYSLYMHLAPPRWGDATADKPFEKAPWLATFLKMQHGAVVNLDPETADRGSTFWSEEPLKSDAAAYKVRERTEVLKGNANGLRSLTKPAPKDVGEAIEAIKKGGIVTFGRPLFPVAAGEILGFLAPGSPASASTSNASPPRYLHWELFSLSGDANGLQLLSEADADLKDLLKALAEPDKEDNFLRMPSDEEPDLPDNDVQALLDSTQVDIVPQLKRAGYYGQQLQTYFNNGSTFFSARDTLAKPFTWPLPLTLENKHKFEPAANEPPVSLEVVYKKAGQVLSRESLPLTPKKDVARLNVTLSVPAAADSVALWSSAFFADRVEIPPADLRKLRHKSRTDLFKKVAGHRWRNVMLEHLNEWTPSGLGKQLEARWKARFFDHLADTHGLTLEDLKKVLLPLCWWDRPTTETDLFGEFPVLMDAEGQKKSLFGAGNALLPKDPHVVSMHPVTALWLIDLLLEDERIRLTKEWPPFTLTRNESSQKPLFLGLIGKDSPPLAGMELLAILVQHGYATTEGSNPIDATFWLTAKGTGGAGAEPQSLGTARYKDGAAATRIRAPSWGQWEVHATSADGQRFEPQQTLATTFDVPKPALSGQPFALGTKPGTPRPLATCTFVVRENWPAALAGYIVFDYWKLPRKEQPDLTATATSASLAVPALASRPPEKRTAGGLRYENDFIVGTEQPGKNPKVTPNFSFREFLTQPGSGARVFAGLDTKFVLSVPLAQRLQQLREGCKPRPGRTQDIKLTVQQLARTGLSLTVGPSSGKLADLDILMTALPPSEPPTLFTVERLEAKVAVKLTYNPPSATSGPLLLEFDPGPALGRLAAEALSDTDAGMVLHVRPRFIVPNSGHALHTAGKIAAVEGVANLFSASATDLQAACGNDFLEIVADKCLPPVGRFEFGDIQVKMGAGVIRTEVALHGDADLWKVAEPVIKLKGASQGKRNKGLLVGDWPLLDKNKQRIPEMWNGPLEFTAELVQPGKVATPAPPVKLKDPIQVAPRLEKLTFQLKGKDFCLVGKGHFIPTDMDFRVVCERQDATSGEWVEHAKITGSMKYANTTDVVHGCCTETGHFEASVPVSMLKKAGGPFRFFWRRRVSRTGAPLPVLGAIIEEPPALEVTDAELGP
jgi:hypothetical protein